MGNMSYSIKVFIYWQFNRNAGRMKTFEEMGFESELTSASGHHNEIVKLLPGVQLWSTDALFWFQRVVYPFIVNGNFSCVPRENHLSLYLGAYSEILKRTLPMVHVDDWVPKKWVQRKRGS